MPATPTMDEEASRTCPELSVVLPSYCEANALQKLLPGLTQAISTLSARHEILVIDAQNPVDNTREVCQGFPSVTHLYRTGGNFYGDAVRTGIREARGKYILFMDADGSHNPAQVTSLWQEREHCDVVIGSRYTKGGATENPRILIFMSWIVNVTFRICFQLHCKDVTNSFRLYRADRVKDLRLQSDNFDIIQELLIKICSGARHGKLIEVPVTFERRKAGESKRDLVKFAFSYFWTLCSLLKIKIAAGRGLSATS